MGLCVISADSERFMSRPHATDHFLHKQLRVKEMHNNLNEVIAKQNLSQIDWSVETVCWLFQMSVGMSIASSAS